MHLAALTAALLFTAAPGDDHTQAPYFRLSDGADRLPLKATRTKVAVAGVIAHVRVTQSYANEGSRPIEAVYVFGASTRAAVFAMTMTIGDRTIVAKVDERDRARRDYEDAKREGREAGLLEQERPNVFVMNVANILPGDRVEVALDYTEMIVPEEGVYEVVVPGVVGPRYDGEGHAEAWTENPHLAEPGPSWKLDAQIVGGAPVRAVRSPSHTIAPHFRETGAVAVQVLDEDGGDRDFVLRYRLDGERIETGLLRYEVGEEGYFAAVVQPPERVAPAMIPPREYVFVVDVSGSMSGFPSETSAALMAKLLGGLRSQDRFNVLLFAGDRTIFAERSVPATPDAIARAAEVVAHMRGGGGTDLLAALDDALALPRDETMSTSFIVLTDGFVTVEQAAFERIREMRGTANVFAFGIGRSVNRHLVEGLARAGSGRPFVVTEREEAAPAAERFRRYVEQPVLTGVTVDFEGVDVDDIARRQPDVFGERPLVIFGRYRGEGSLTIRGTGGAGPFERTLTFADAPPSDDLVALEYLWARERIERLGDRSQDEATKKAIVALGLEHNLLTPYTSFVAIGEHRTSQGSTTVRQPLATPKGVDPAKSGALGVIQGAKFGALKGGAGYGVGGLRGGGGYGKIGLGGRGLGTVGHGRGGGGIGVNVGGEVGAPIVMGSLSKEVIRRVITANHGRLRAAFERSLKRDPTIDGRFVFEIVIGGDGRVSRVRVTKGDGDEHALRDILAVIRAMKFPPPKGGGVVVVRYPLIFRADKDDR